LQPVSRPGLGCADASLLKRKLLLFAGWGWAAAIVVLSLIPTTSQADVDHGDKLGHFAAYGLLMFLFCQIDARRLAYALGFTLMGVTLEFLQGMTGYRNFDLLDMLANTIGVALGWLIGHHVRVGR
jgi:VanZ family protein